MNEIKYEPIDYYLYGIMSLDSLWKGVLIMDYTDEFVQALCNIVPATRKEAEILLSGMKKMLESEKISAESRGTIESVRTFLLDD